MAGDFNTLSEMNRPSGQKISEDTAELHPQHQEADSERAQQSRLVCSSPEPLSSYCKGLPPGGAESSMTRPQVCSLEGAPQYCILGPCIHAVGASSFSIILLGHIRTGHWRTAPPTQGAALEHEPCVTSQILSFNHSSRNRR